MLEVWSKVKEGSQESFMELYDMYYKPLFHYGLKIKHDRELVKECLHILFCELWEQRERLPVPRHDARFYLFTWLKRIIFRQYSTEHFPLDQLSEQPLERSVEEERIQIEEILELHTKLEKALAKLSKKQRKYIEWRFFENKSYEEIAQLDDVSIRTVYNVIYESLKRLKGDMAVFSFLIFIFSK
ncbi:RNA polymerase sigma factor [Sphingobacterium gobiense]|uniref:RNA polymerase sigma factor 70 region 4 type 2 domain-containing protein n=1 Tax=Sphingobacterium gobiense TaxID=1382456 RepID=A0A2S9JTX5_9SPHI|nr:sigma-70 family RNA polymerase sigma factor [Sphingobacterium gobiense]PRD56678.1 hypothetical protein C5749_05460 [Sphingobacterium gobiense]